MKRATEIRPGPKRLACLAVALVVLSGCEETLATAEKPDENTSKNELFPQSSDDTQRDVEAPDVFQLTEAGLWDGRPSLGGIWVAHPDVTQPERVIIKNASNNKSVTGALFRRERNLPGPALQVSSAAAEQLGILAGAPTKINVVALRRETVEAPPEPEVAEAETAPEASTETAAASDVAEVNASEATSETEKPAKRKWWQKKAPAAAATAGVVGAAAVAANAAEDGAEAAVATDVAEVDASDATSETEKPAKRKWWQKKDPATAATAGSVGAAAVASDAAVDGAEAAVEATAEISAASTAPALTDAPVVAPEEKPAKRKWWQKKDPNAITETTLDPIEGAAAAIDAAEPTPVAATAATTSSLSKPFVQVGTFGVQSNADSAAAKIRRNGMSAEVRELKTEDNTVWRVLVGPAATRAERKAIQNDVKDLGFGDAFTVAN
ncbi:SPOR domain-containing protein [Ruegeria profundi]|uniref:SPOR domain-containing protein n=1 Tax=Ruegeria profundi TaxID=1685378 RepID=UPI003C7C9425